MKKLVLVSLTALSISIIGSLELFSLYKKSTEFGAPPYQGENPGLDFNGTYLNGTYFNSAYLNSAYFDEYANWQRPEGPVKIGLQAGHWKTDEMPEEQERIKNRGGGTTSQGLAEWEIVLAIAEKTAEILEEKGYEVNILPATIPENYWADAFVSIHADGNLSRMVRGFKVAAYQRDRTGNAGTLSAFITQKYGETTGFPQDSNVTTSMTRYYAFNSRRYQHAIHPTTPGVIVETGFVTNYREASILINNPEIPAQGIADGIILFIEDKVITLL